MTAEKVFACNKEQAFIEHLREEKLRQQDKRAAYIRSKFAFVVGMFGFVVAVTGNNNGDDVSIWLSRFIYLVPFVAFLFDLYILGGEWAIKRIRSFLSTLDSQELCEKKWDAFLDKWPKAFMRNNRLWVTNGIFAIAIIFTVMNLLKCDVSHYEWVWFSLWIICIAVMDIYLFGIENKIRKAIYSIANSSD
ncbi:MAG: hypothetical protein SWH61_05105 [Thermodesulfobacteriota bacterium]|nr:hypothetical protein [Thermodesulfobacteriota bacterium]